MKEENHTFEEMCDRAVERGKLYDSLVTSPYEDNRRCESAKLERLYGSSCCAKTPGIGDSGGFYPLDRGYDVCEISRIYARKGLREGEYLEKIVI